MSLLKQSSTAQPLVFLMVQSVDHLTGATGLTPTVTLSKNGGAFASPSGAVTEIANGWYRVAGNATDTGTLGPLVLHATSAGADPVDVLYEVVAFDPQSATNLGLTNLDATVSSRSTYAGGAVASVTGAVGSVTGNVGGNVVGSVGSVASFGTLVADVATAVWAAVTRTLTAASDSAGVTTLLTRIASVLTITGGKVDVNDKTGFSLSVTPPTAAQVRAEMDANSTQLAAIKSEVDTILADVNTGAGAIYTRLGAPAGASLAADVAAVKSDSAAINAKTTNLPASPAAVGSAMTLTAGERDSIAADLLDLSGGVETSLTLRQALRLLVAANAGKVSGAATTTITIRNYGDTKNRLVAQVDSSGNRESITYDLT